MTTGGLDVGSTGTVPRTVDPEGSGKKKCGMSRVWVGGTDGDGDRTVEESPPWTCTHHT